MSSLGVSRRVRRLEGPGGRFFFLALDHGLPAGPLPGIEEPRSLASRLRPAPITGVIANPGMVRHLGAAIPALVVHLSAGTRLGAHPTSKVLSSTVERGLALGADAVSAQVHFGDPQQDRMLSDAGAVVDAAGDVGLPVLLMAHPPASAPVDVGAARHAARAAAELRARIVQIPYTGTPKTFREVVRGCPVPLLIAGGPRASPPEAFLETVRGAIAAGAAGVSAGRNLFQHPDPAALATRVGEILFGPAPRIGG